MRTKLRPYIAIAAAIVLVAALFLPVPQKEAAPVVEMLPTPTPVVETPVPPTPTPDPPAITPPADNAASGSDLILQPIDPATDSDLSVSAETPVAPEASLQPTQPVADA